MLAKVTVFCLLKIQINIISMNRNLNCEETSIHSFSTEDCSPRLWLQQLRKKYVWVSWGFLGHLVHFEFLNLFGGYYRDNGRSSWLRKLNLFCEILYLLRNHCYSDQFERQIFLEYICDVSCTILHYWVVWFILPLCHFIHVSPIFTNTYDISRSHLL